MHLTAHLAIETVAVAVTMALHVALVILRSFWGHVGIIVGSFWGYVGLDHVAVIWASCLYQRFPPKCCGADFGSRIKISGNLLGQSDQNFDIYPFDWSQVASWGLAAEGEALTIFS